jgi:hypothetical protein
VDSLQAGAFIQGLTNDFNETLEKTRHADVKRYLKQFANGQHDRANETTHLFTIQTKLA